jgi:hypothetical protein
MLSVYVSSGLPDFYWYVIPEPEQSIPNDHKIHIPNGQQIFKMAKKYTKWPTNIQNGQKICQHNSLQRPRNYTQIGILGLKIFHLATLRLIIRH